MQTENGGEGAPLADGQPAPEENALTGAVAPESAQEIAPEAAVAPTDGEAATEQPQPAAEPPKPRQRDWATKRIDELTGKRHEAERRAETLQRELEAARAIIAGKKPEGEGAPTASTPEATAPDFQTAVQREAARLAAEQTFNQRCNTVFDAGLKQHGSDFQEGVADLNRAGVLNRHFIDAALETEAPEALLYHLGQDVGEAQRIAALSPTKMAIELDRLAQKVAKPAANPVSKAPPPITPVTGTARGDFNFADPNADDAEWYRRREEQRAARSGR